MSNFKLLRMRLKNLRRSGATSQEPAREKKKNSKKTKNSKRKTTYASWAKIAANAGKPQSADMGKQKAPARRYPGNNTKTKEETVDERSKKKFEYYKKKKSTFE